MVQRSLSSLIKKIEQDLDQVRDQFLRNVAEDLVASSPVDTGAYVSNHSITTSSGAGGTKNSQGRNTDTGTAREEALNKLNGQISELPPDAAKVYISNRSPYANRVEYSGWGRTGPYQVFSSVRSRAGNHLQDAINKVRGTQ